MGTIILDVDEYGNIRDWRIACKSEGEERVAKKTLQSLFACIEGRKCQRPWRHRGTAAMMKTEIKRAIQ
jgi:hypothetical protein